jgi:hypothetical protein
MFFEAIAAVVGIGTAAYGAYQNDKQTDRANRSIAQSNAAQKKVAEQNKIASQHSVAAEKLRKQQMELEGIRRRRDIIRQAQGARALGIARANASGAALTDSSVQAGQQQAATSQRADTLANLQNIQIGRNIFKENMEIYKAQAKGATIQTQANQYQSMAQQSMNNAQWGQQLFGAGLNIAQSAPAFGRVATNIASGTYNLFGG